MFQCNWCDEYIENERKIYTIKKGMVIDKENENLVKREYKYYCSIECLIEGEIE